MKKITIAFFVLFSHLIFAQKQDPKITKEISKLKKYTNEKPSAAGVKYAGQVVFSNAELIKGATDPGYISSYNFGDKLYIKGYLTMSVGNNVLIQQVEQGQTAKFLNGDAAADTANLLYKLYIDGKEVTKTESGDFRRGEIGTWTEYVGCFNDGTGKYFFGEDLYRNLLKEPEVLTPGNHKLKIEMVPICSECPNYNPVPVAVGEIDMVVPKEIKVNAGDCFPVKQMTDAKLEAEAVNACKNTNPNAIKAILMSQLTIIKNEYTGVILRETFTAAIVSKKNDEVSFDIYLFNKEYDGSKFLGATISKDPENYLLAKKQKVNKDCLKFLK